MGSYNPLCSKLQSDGLESWLCIAEHEVPFFRARSFDEEAGTCCNSGDSIKAIKQGDWLEDKETGFFIPYHSLDGKRHFKNQRLVLMEQAQRSSACLRAASNDSIVSRVSYSSIRRAYSDECNNKVRTEVWVCINEGGVRYHTAPVLHDSSKKECPCGGKVVAEKQGNWLQVMEVDKGGVRATGLFLPLATREGRKLFVSDMETRHNCSVM
eukprot:CAMPEP_0171059504 /NCGR_PEP_ID=MMETSP0766_2-20121228/3216_1 /TAXON_ID=439317 /ORGANISM="Gambierdiscus australes, Strain CAWD 149" /LENGTH=210 /DNA_ID=CAMNT_0011514949 /DNA_START=79 /DNA_END=711 /DNA_ORIENTATION=-